MSTFRNHGEEGRLLIVIDTLDFDRSVYIDASLLELTLLLQLSQSACLFKLFLTDLTRRLLTLSISKASTTLLKHLFLVFIHVDWIRSRRLSFRIRVDLAGKAVSCIVRVIGITPLCDIEELFVLLNALLGGAANELGDRAPHRWENL